MNPRLALYLLLFAATLGSVWMVNKKTPLSGPPAVSAPAVQKSTRTAILPRTEAKSMNPGQSPTTPPPPSLSDYVKITPGENETQEMKEIRKKMEGLAQRIIDLKTQASQNRPNLQKLAGFKEESRKHYATEYAKQIKDAMDFLNGGDPESRKARQQAAAQITAFLQPLFLAEMVKDPAYHPILKDVLLTRFPTGGQKLYNSGDRELGIYSEVLYEPLTFEKLQGELEKRTPGLRELIATRQKSIAMTDSQLKGLEMKLYSTVLGDTIDSYLQLNMPVEVRHLEDQIRQLRNEYLKALYKSQGQ